MRLTFVLFQMSQLRAAKRVCKNPGTKAYYLTKSCNDVARREWLYRDGAARKVLGNRDFVFGDGLTRENLLKIAVTADEIRGGQQRFRASGTAGRGAVQACWRAERRSTALAKRPRGSLFA